MKFIGINTNREATLKARLTNLRHEISSHAEQSKTKNELAPTLALEEPLIEVVEALEAQLARLDGSTAERAAKEARAEADEIAKAYQTFTNFGKLPEELQLKICKFQL